MDFSVAFNRVSHCGLLHKLRSIGIRGYFLSIVSGKGSRAFGW